MLPRFRQLAGYGLICLLSLFSAVVHADSPPTIAVASAHPLATQAGLEILAAGGNAFDAAVAVSAALAVVEPTGSGLGGGGFWLLHIANNDRDVMIDGREKAPGRAYQNMYLDKKGQVIPGRSIDGPLAAGIPGEPAALVHIAQHYGKLPLHRSLAPAITYARQGFEVDDHYRRLARFRLPALQRSSSAAAIFLVDRAAPAIGDTIRQPELAETLTALAEQGRPGFYQGPVAKRLVSGVRKGGGNWTLADLADYRVVERKPITGQYHGITVTSAAPPSSGGIALLTMLNILAGYRVDQMSGVERTHTVVEAMRRAYRDRAIFLGDPDFINVPVKRLIHPWYAAGLRSTIRLDRATPSHFLASAPPDPAMGRNTSHFSILDKEGNYVAATLSINYPFGSGFVAPGTGVLLNDEMDDFSAKPGKPNVYGLVGGKANAITPGKRPLSSMSPTFLADRRGIVILGTPGGSRIITMVLLAILDYANGGDARSMVSQPRFHHQYLPDEIQLEPHTFSEHEMEHLRNLGHQLKPLQRRYGNMQVVFWDRSNGHVSAAADPRGHGVAEVR